MNDLINTLLSRYDAADKYLENKRDSWDEFEGIFLNKVDDKISGTTKNVISDPVLATMAIERSNRVMSQLPTGKVRMMSKNDEGTSKLMNMTLDKWVVPNANAQWDLLTKMRMVDQYSNIYGNFFVMIDWDVKKNGYIGPDMWLLNIRDVFPQVGAVSLEDSDYVIVRTWKPKSYFEGLKDQEGYQNIPEILRKLENASGTKANKSATEKSKRDYDYPEPIATNGAGYYSIISMYERDRWVDYLPFANQTFRDTDNPHNNGELPVVCKYSIPLLDDFMGMGDFERGKSQQYLLNGIWNLWTAAMRISIFPPTIINKDAIAAAHTLKLGPAEKWLMRGSPSNAVAPLNIAPQGLDTFQVMRQTVVGALLNQFGTTFTDTSATTNSEMGKTPTALKMQAVRQSARDNADQFYMEQFLKKVYNRFTNLISKKQPKALTIRLFPEELRELVQQYPEMEEDYNDRTGKLTIKQSKFKGCLFDYEMISGSTYQADKETQKENLRSIFQTAIQGLQLNPQTGEVSSPMIERLKQEGRDFKLSEVVTRILADSGIPSWDKITPDLTNGNPEQYQQDQLRNQQDMALAQQMQQIMQQATQGSQINQIPPEMGGGGMNEAPTGYQA